SITEARGFVDSLLLVDVEADAADVERPVEIEHAVRIEHGNLGQHRDDVEGNIPALQALQAGDRLVECPSSVAWLGRGVVNVARAIDADAEPDIPPLEEIAPAVIDEHAVGLERMREGDRFRHVPNAREGRLIVGGPEHERLARMPDDGDPL